MISLHPQLKNDCHILGRLNLCTLLLHKNAEIPWLILVPDTDREDLFELPVEQQHLALAECSFATEILKSFFLVNKLNFAAIGNLVPQLHLHVVGRRSDDACWPKPVWGNLTETVEYSADCLHDLISEISRQAEQKHLQFLKNS